jgi:hypothetical protein
VLLVTYLLRYSYATALVGLHPARIGILTISMMEIRTDHDKIKAAITVQSIVSVPYNIYVTIHCSRIWTRGTWAKGFNAISHVNLRILPTGTTVLRYPYLTPNDPIYQCCCVICRTRSIYLNQDPSI